MRFQASHIPLLLAGLAGLLVSVPARAQASACHTTNCAVGIQGNPMLPAQCKTRLGAQPVASPRVFEVQMDSSMSGGSCLAPANTFKPNLIRIEGKNTIAPAVNPWDYQCIEWHRTGNCPAPPWHSATENTIGNTCVTATSCAATGANGTPSPCAFETGNINASAPNPILEYGSCHYRDIAVATYPFQCRLHTSMTGMLTVVNSIKLDVKKGAGGSVDLSWPAPSGSANGPWDIFRHTDPKMPKDAGLIRLSPAAGQSTTRTFNDTGCAPAPGQLCAYMVRECNQIGGICVN